MLSDSAGLSVSNMSFQLLTSSEEGVSGTVGGVQHFNPVNQGITHTLI